jgi:hypothetical protein
MVKGFLTTIVGVGEGIAVLVGTGAVVGGEVGVG